MKYPFKLYKIRKYILFFILVFLIGIFYVSNVYSQNNSEEVKTHLEIENTPPLLIKPIPNQSWPSNENLTNAFDLDDYFEDESGLPLRYNFSYVENITIVIDSENRVSFFPDKNFTGIRKVFFYAYDEIDNEGISNEVYLFVGADEEPPCWYNPILIRRTKRVNNTIYQNDYLNFSAIWTDNLQLKDYFFSIDQGEGWIDYEIIPFNGVYNISRYSVQVSASPGSVVYWKFCARDTTKNQNCTDIQFFNVSVRLLPSPPPAPERGGEGIGGIGGIAQFFAGIIREKKIQNFSVDPDKFKISLKQGSRETRILKISNIGNTNITVNLSVEEINNFVLLSDDYAEIDVGKDKKITIDFFAPLNTIPDQYFGKIILKSYHGYKEIPVLIDINVFEPIIEIDVNISSKYKLIKQGEKIKANLTIRIIKDIPPGDFKLYYAIKDFYGNIYDSNEETIFLGSSLEIERELRVPEDVYLGEYIFYARVYNEKISAIDSDSFVVGYKFKVASFFRSFMILIFIILFSIITLILVFRYKKEKEKERILSLYLLINELKDLVNEGKLDEAINIYIRIKKMYGEPLSKEIIEDKEKLKKEIKELTEKLKENFSKLKEEKPKKEEEDSKKESKKENPTLDKKNLNLSNDSVNK